MTAYLLMGDGRTLCRTGSADVPGRYLTAPAAKAGGLIVGVQVRAQGAWVMDLPPEGAARPPFTTDAWSSQMLTSGIGVLSLGPVPVSAGMSVGLPLLTGPGASAVRVSIVDRRTGEVRVATHPPAGTSTWDLWRFDLPVGAPEMEVEYVVEHAHKGAGDWVMVGLPRLIMP